MLGRHLAQFRCQVHGIDASQGLIARAQERAGDPEKYEVGDAHDISSLVKAESVDHAAIVLALQDLDPIDDVLKGVYRALKPGGRLVTVLVHPCFRPPQASDWQRERDADQRAGGKGSANRERISRSVWGYLHPRELKLETHPGKNSSASSASFHRPLMHYMNAFGKSGLPVVAMEELATPWRGETDHPAWQKIAQEIPTFMVLAGQKAG